MIMKNSIQMIKQCIEKDEPYFLLRGQDRCALMAIEAYVTAIDKNGSNPSFIEEVKEIQKDFQAYQKEVTQTKTPD